MVYLLLLTYFTSVLFRFFLRFFSSSFIIWLPCLPIVFIVFCIILRFSSRKTKKKFTSNKIIVQFFHLDIRVAHCPLPIAIFYSYCFISVETHYIWIRRKRTKYSKQPKLKIKYNNKQQLPLLPRTSIKIVPVHFSLSLFVWFLFLLNVQCVIIIKKIPHSFLVRVHCIFVSASESYVCDMKRRRRGTTQRPHQSDLSIS